METRICKDQFVKLPNSVVVKDHNPGVLALYATAAFLFTLPSGYNAPGGGLKEQLKRLNRKGARFEPSWRTFRNYYFDLFRAPLGLNRYTTLYDLHSSPRPAPVLSRRVPCLSSEKGSAFVSYYKAPDADYVKVPLSLLWDQTLSVTAKGIIILLLREIELAKHISGYTVSKNNILRRCGLYYNRRAAITSAWEEAKASGYLIQYRANEEGSGHPYWVYEVIGTSVHTRNLASVTSPSHCNKTKHPVPKTNRKDTSTKYPNSAKKGGTTTANRPLTAEERQQIRSALKERFEYDYLVDKINCYDIVEKRDVADSYIDLLCEPFFTQKEMFRIGGENIPTVCVRERFLKLTVDHILYVADQVAKNATTITSPHAYKLTALYRATETYVEYEWGIVG